MRPEIQQSVKFKTFLSFVDVLFLLRMSYQKMVHYSCSDLGIGLLSLFRSISSCSNDGNDVDLWNMARL